MKTEIFIFITEPKKVMFKERWSAWHDKLYESRNKGCHENSLGQSPKYNKPRNRSKYERFWFRSRWGKSKCDLHCAGAIWKSCGKAKEILHLSYRLRKPFWHPKTRKLHIFWKVWTWRDRTLSWLVACTGSGRTVYAPIPRPGSTSISRDELGRAACFRQTCLILYCYL